MIEVVEVVVGMVEVVEVVEVVVMVTGGAWVVVDGSGAGTLDEEELVVTCCAELDDEVA